MLRKLALPLFLIIALILTACGGDAEASGDDAIATIVAATLEAANNEAQPEAAGTGSIAGSLSYPSEGIPPLNVVAYSVSSADWYMVVTELNQTSYQIDNLPAGDYYVVAYPTDSDYAGGYTASVLCGLGAECTDHALLPVTVTAGNTTDAVDPGDWYAGENAFPPNPAKVASTGTLSGALGYPSEGIPAMDVIAFTGDGQTYYLLQTAQNQTSYQFDNLPAGTYTVVAYIAGSSDGGGYTAAVVCGLTADCTNHSLMPVVVAAGGATENVDLTDWYAGENAFPANPLASTSTDSNSNSGNTGTTDSGEDSAQESGFGGISGGLSYPSSGIPSMYVVAFNLAENTWFYVITGAGQSFYQISNLPAGNYWVVAYPVGQSDGGGYTDSSHNLLTVVVKADEVTENINPTDWNAGPGAFPANPVP